MLKSRWSKLSKIWSLIIRQYWNGERKELYSNRYGTPAPAKDDDTDQVLGFPLASSPSLYLSLSLPIPDWTLTKNVSGWPRSKTSRYAWTVRNPKGCPSFHSARLSTGKRRCTPEPDLMPTYSGIVSQTDSDRDWEIVTCMGTSTTTSSRTWVSQTRQFL